MGDVEFAIFQGSHPYILLLELLNPSIHTLKHRKSAKVVSRDASNKSR